MDISEFREPVEVYRAAIGQPEALIKRLGSKEPINSWERGALAAYFERKLVPPKRGRGEAKPRYLHSYAERDEAYRLPNAETHYRYIMAELRKAGEAYGRASEALEFVAQKYGLDPEALNNYLRRPAREKAGRKPRRPEGVVEMFHAWLYREGLCGA